MWKSLISNGQKATHASRHHVSTGLCSTSTSMGNRTFSTIPSLQKDSQPTDIDREALNPQRSEVSKSGTDDEIAHHDSAFDPSNTAPESELAATEKESKSGKKGTLNMSPANKDVNAWRGPTEGGPDRNVERGASSARGSPNKRRTIHVKEDGTHVAYR
ncbi:hypothetical protein N7532_008746 [Penicillium argentinense]|uniref:Uncharacterized protein n=1 Tax=Penicillium argentinense TaxID=1131581 RepID=A0A9W9K2T9_9EURO|nr:uncharacterized protein N7532_008746 [Penicillium argentinense]KAJ5090062.1 hypothetical protein N7532_008746 [Penicillium argentinense]